MKTVYLKAIRIASTNLEHVIYCVVKLTKVHQLVNFIQCLSLIDTARIIPSDVNEYKLNKESAMPAWYYDKPIEKSYFNKLVVRGIHFPELTERLKL